MGHAVKGEQQEARELAMRKNTERITKKVLDALGTPPNLVRVIVTHIVGRTYRVNVQTADMLRADTLDVLHTKTAHSFFVFEIDPQAHLNSDPPIVEKYKKTIQPQPIVP